jgi:hypothetical protein
MICFIKKHDLLISLIAPLKKNYSILMSLPKYSICNKQIKNKKIYYDNGVGSNSKKPHHSNDDSNEKEETKTRICQKCYFSNRVGSDKR